MSKTLLVTLDFPPLLGGVANYYYERVKAMPEDEIVVLMNTQPFVIPAKAGIQVKKKWIPDQVGDDKKEVLIFRKKFFIKYFWPHWLPLVWHVYKIVKKEKINKIWVGQVLPVGTAVWVVSKILNIFNRRDPSTSASPCSAYAQDDKKRPLSFFVTCHGNDLLRAKKNKRKFKLAQKILKDAEFVEANTEFTKNILVNDFAIPAEKIKIIYPINTLTKAMVDLQKVGELRARYNLANKKVLLTVGRLVESKGIDLVLQALPKVWQSVPDLVYLVVGDGPDKNRLVQIVNKLIKLPPLAPPYKGGDGEAPHFRSNVLVENGTGGAGGIIFTGAVAHNELSNYYDLTDVFILTPRKNSFGDTESFGVVYLEAKEFGLPIIAGNVGGALEIAKNYDQMHLIDSENSNEIIEKIIEIIK